MRNSIPFILGFTTIALLVPPQTACADMRFVQDAEDSPLYATSMRNSFSDMAARDRGLLAPPEASRDANAGWDNIIAVEGGAWHTVPAGAKDPRPRPLGVTTEVTCTGNPTCGMVITCQIIGKTCQSYPTCAGNETCTWTVTCNNTCTFYPTCSGSGQPTCWGPTCGSPTCAGLTCGPGPTCSAMPTCSGGPTCGGASTCFSTCYGSATCYDTCTAAHCSQPGITNVNVPQPGRFQFSFHAAGQQVSYNVLYCTNLEAAQWTTVFSIPANNTTVTFIHTNNAARAYYRLSIQNL